jgi:hypothetical protein
LVGVSPNAFPRSKPGAQVPQPIRNINLCFRKAAAALGLFRYELNPGLGARDFWQGGIAGPTWTQGGGRRGAFYLSLEADY